MRRRRILALLLALSSWQEATGLKFVFLPLGGNSPAMDLMGVAAALQARCETGGRAGTPWQPVTLPKLA